MNLEILRPVFLSVLLAGTVLPLVSCAAERLLLKKASASMKHRLWTLTALGLLCFPVIVLILQGGNREPIVESAIFETEIPETDVVEKEVPGIVSVSERTEVRPVSYHPPRSAEPEIPAPWAFDAESRVAADPVSVLATPLESAPEISRQHVLDTAAALWFLGIALVGSYFLVIHFKSLLFLLRIQKERQNEHSPTAPPRVWFSEETSIPFAFGIFRPVVVFPSEAHNWSRDKFDAVLQHELAHIARRDLFWQNVVCAACVLCWFHPFVWFIRRRIRTEQELACDDMVLQSGKRSSDYASVLLELSKNLSARRPIPEGGLAMLRKKTVVQRIDSILDEKTSRKPISRKATLGLFSGVLLLSFCVSLFAPKIPLPLFAQDSPATPAPENEESAESTDQDRVSKLEELLARDRIQSETWSERNQGKIKWTPEEQREFLDRCIETSTEILSFPLDEKTKEQKEHGRMFWIRMIAFDDFQAGKQRYEKVIAELEKTPGNEKTIKGYRAEIFAVSMNDLMKREDYAEKLAALKAEILQEFETDPEHAAFRAQAMLMGVRSFCERTLMPFDEVMEFYESGMKEFIPYFKKSEDPGTRNIADSYEGKLRFRGLTGKKLDLEGVLIDGEKFDWNSYRGKPVLVYFDSPTEDTDEYCSLAYFTDAFHRVEEKYKDKGLQFVGYAMVFPGKENRYPDEDMLKAMDRAKLPGVMISGNKSLAAGYKSMNVYYGCSFSPCVLLVDRDGTVLSTRIGHVHKNFADKNGEVELDHTLRSYFETGKVPEPQVYVSPEKQEILDREKNKALWTLLRTELESDVENILLPGLSGSEFAGQMGTLLGKILLYDSRINEARRNRIQTDFTTFIKERLPENLSPKQRRTIVEGTLRFSAFSLIGSHYDEISERLENLRWRVANILREEPISEAESALLKEQLDFMRKFVSEYPMGKINVYGDERKTPEERLAQLDSYVNDPFCPFFKKPFDEEQWEKFLKNLDRCKNSGFGTGRFRAVPILCNAVGFTIGPTKRGPGSVELSEDGPIFDFRHPGAGTYVDLFAYDNDNEARRTAGNIAKPGYWPLDPEAHKNMFENPDKTVPPLSRREAIELAKKNDAGDFLYDGTANELVGIDGTVFAPLDCSTREQSDRFSDAELRMMLDENGVAVYPLKEIMQECEDGFCSPAVQKFLVAGNTKGQMIVFELTRINTMEQAMKFRETNPDTRYMSRLAEISGRFFPRPIPPDALTEDHYAPNGVMRKTR